MKIGLVVNLLCERFFAILVCVAGDFVGAGSVKSRSQKFGEPAL